MARPRLELGTWGKITRTESAPGKWRARARFRGFDGKTRLVEAWEASGNKAQRKLEAELRARAQVMGGDLDRETRLHELGRLWLAEAKASNLTRQTLNEYENMLTKYIDPALGQYAIREASVGTLDRFLKSIGKDKPATAKQVKVVLGHMFGLAVRMDVIATNPIKDTVLPVKPTPEPRPLNRDEVLALREGIYEWMTEKGTRGPKRAPDLLDIVDMLLATGMRVGELCALRWDDVDLGAESPSLVITGTVVWNKGEGLTRQPHRKGSKRYLRVFLPEFAVAILMRKQVEAMPSQWNTVFPSSTGTLRNPHNLRRQIRDARAAAGFGWVTPHTFRKTVLTEIERVRGIEEAAAQAGHKGTEVTQRHYVRGRDEAPDNTEVLNPMGARDFMN